MLRILTLGTVLVGLMSPFAEAQRNFVPAPIQSRPSRQAPEIVGTVKEYEEAKTMLVGYTPGNIDRATEICEEAGLTVKEESRRASYVVCSWTTPDVLQKALAALRKERVLKYAQPNSYLLVDLPAPEYPAAPQQAKRAVDRVLLASSRSSGGIGGRSTTSGSSRTPNDEFYEQLWGMESIRAPQAWQRATETSIVVAVLDSGVDDQHPDLQANMFRHTSQWNGQEYADKVGMDFGSFIDPETGEYVGTPQPDPKPIRNPDRLSDGSHGTHCAGTIAAIGNNRIGVAGVNWKARIMALQVFTVVDDKNGDGKRDIVTFDRAQVDAIQYAIDHGAKILSNSYGGIGSESPAVRTAIQRANDSGVLFVAAAGNENNDNDQKKTFPASYPLPNVLAVAATNRQDRLSAFSPSHGSNFGATTVHLGAPGGEMISRREDGVLSTIPPALNENQKYAFNQGTSMACPLVAGAAALVWDQPQYKNLNPQQLRDLLVQKSRRVDGLTGKCVSGGILDISFLGLSHQSAPSCGSPRVLMGCGPCQSWTFNCCSREMCYASKHGKRTKWKCKR